MRSKGWGLVEFADAATAELAVSTLNNAELNGRGVHVRLDRVHTEVAGDTFNLFVGNIPWTMTNQELIELFQTFHPADCHILTNMYGKSRGFAIVKFAAENDAAAAIQAMNRLEVKGRQIECRFDRGPGKSEDSEANNSGGGKGSLFVGRLDARVDDAALAAIFAPIGAVSSAKVQRHPDGKSKGWGIVCFEDANHAKIAVDTMNGKTVATTAADSQQQPIRVRLDRK